MDDGYAFLSLKFTSGKPG